MPRCFLALLLVAAVLWKIKQKYDMYRRRQRLFVEMEQMASRPFSQVLVEIERRDVDNSDSERSESELTNCRKKKKVRVVCSLVSYTRCTFNNTIINRLPSLQSFVSKIPIFINLI